MSTTSATNAATAKPVPRVFSQYGASARPVGGTGFETFSWYFFRWSGIGLLFLVIIHLVLMHITTDVGMTNYAFVAARYANPFWRVYDLLLLTLALLHGLNGLRVIVDDYVNSNGWRLFAQSVVALTAAAFWLMGTMTIITFQPNHTLAQTLLGLLGR
jgi:succinate dehydrogenase / fumarate reductase membrane anchor subunit